MMRALFLLLLTVTTAHAQASRVTLIGTVRDSAGGSIPLAQVSMAGISVLADSSGSFVLGSVPSGRSLLEVRRLGYAPLDMNVELLAGRTNSIAVVLTPVPIDLPRVSTDDEAYERQHLVDFYRHRDTGNGYFFNRRELEAKRVHRISDVIRQLPGVRLAPDRAGRTHLRMARSNCRPDFWVDGQRSPMLAIDDVPLRDVQALEVYRGASSIPPEYNNALGSPSCGAVVIWTRLPG